jgi:Protein of unknown function (DUF4089)
MMDRVKADAAIAVAASVLALDIEAAHCDDVVANYLRLCELAELVLGFPLDDHEDAGPVFTP